VIKYETKVKKMLVVLFKPTIAGRGNGIESPPKCGR
jgi:hypothetical protein